MKPSKNLRVFCSTQQGARTVQEDRHGHWSAASGGKTRHFAIVIDGAGGHGGGDVAAQAALDAARDAWKRAADDEPEAFLAAWMRSAHDAVNRAGSQVTRSVRAVAVACITDGESAQWVHAGDSRLLHFSGGVLKQRTRDDSVVQVLFEQGEITEEEMGSHPDQGRLLQALGGEDPPRPRQGSASLGEEDVLLLCSDGLWEHLSREELEQLARTPAARMSDALDKAVALAVRRAGPKADNTTAVVITRGGKSAHRLIKLLSVSLVAGLLLAGAAVFFMNNPALKLDDAVAEPPKQAEEAPDTAAAAEPDGQGEAADLPQTDAAETDATMPGPESQEGPPEP